MAFLSTLSLRRATQLLRGDSKTTLISIHALLAESDGSLLVAGVIDAVFLSTLSLRRATAGCMRMAHTAMDFYPRSPCGERQQKCTKQWGTFAHMKQILWGLHLHADR